MQDDEEADFGAEMLGIGGNGAQGFGNSAEENAVDHFLVLVSDGGNLFRQSEDDVEVMGIEKLGLTILDPLSTSQGLAFCAVAIAA
jgi:hypothetical protein